MSEAARQESGVRRVLVIDDNAVTREALAEVATDFGYETTAYADAESAWEGFLQQRPQLLIVDWMLPGEDGISLIRRVRQSSAGQYVCILMLTGRTAPEDLETAIKAGANFFINKPLDWQHLQIWLSVAAKVIDDLEALAEKDARLLASQRELEGYNDQLEEAISRANQLAMEAERAFIEINQIFKTVAGGILLIDTDCRLLRCNDAFLQMVGCRREEAIGRNCYEIFHSALCHTADCPLSDIKDGAERVESKISQPEPGGGRDRHYHLIATPFKGPAGELIGVVEHITDITELVRAEEALKESERRYRELSIRDELTKLFNKRYFNTHLPLEIERARRYRHPLSLLLMDIDNFKLHNDTYGHADGDKVLARLGGVIAGSIRLNDIACRYGGEEFVVVLPETDGRQAAVVAERIRERFAAQEFFPRPNEKVQKTLSVGIAAYRQEEAADAMVERADANMYVAKEQGRNRVVGDDG